MACLFIVSSLNHIALPAIVAAERNPIDECTVDWRSLPVAVSFLLTLF